MNCLCSINTHAFHKTNAVAVSDVLTGAYSSTPISGYTYGYSFVGNGTIKLVTTKAVNIIVVGGGGGGGYSDSRIGEGSGGGGAGGVGYGTITLVAGVSYNITIGTGGNGGISYSTIATIGSNSSIVGGSISETAYGGGRGGSCVWNSGQSGGGGGCGGGGNWSWIGSLNVGGTATMGAGSLTYIGNNGGKAYNSGGGGYIYIYALADTLHALLHEVP